MLELFYTDTASCSLKRIDEGVWESENFDFHNVWINMVNPTDKEIESIARLTSTPEDLIKAPLDEEERARIESEDSSTALVLVDIPVLEEEEGYYSYTTLPMGIIHKKDYIITVCLKDTVILRDFVVGRIKGFRTFHKTKFLFQILYNISTKFLAYLKQIDKASGRIQNELHKSTRNKELIQLLDLENSLVYFSTSLKANDMVLNKLIKINVVKKYDEDNDLLEDVQVENQQAIEMCNIYRDILSGTMDAYASVISNNQNKVMKTLTVITLMISIPSLIASIFGMNTGVPGQGSIFAFWIVVAVSLIVSLIAGVIMFKSKKF